MTAAGVKMVKGDMEDVSSYSSYLEGAYGAFVNADCERSNDVAMTEEILENLVELSADSPRQHSLGKVLYKRFRRRRRGRV